MHLPLYLLLPLTGAPQPRLSTRPTTLHPTTTISPRMATRYRHQGTGRATLTTGAAPHVIFNLEKLLSSEHQAVDGVVQRFDSDSGGARGLARALVGARPQELLCNHHGRLLARMAVLLYGALPPLRHSTTFIAR